MDIKRVTFERGLFRIYTVFNIFCFLVWSIGSVVFWAVGGKPKDYLSASENYVELLDDLLEGLGLFVFFLLAPWVLHYFAKGCFLFFKHVVIPIAEYIYKGFVGEDKVNKDEEDGVS